MSEIENSVNQMYGALTKLSQRSESSAAEMEGGILQLQEVAEQIGQDSQLLTQAASQTREKDQFQLFINPQFSLKSAPPKEVLNGEPGKMSKDSLQARLSAIVESE